MTADPTSPPVFISYARTSKATEARALKQELGAEAFLDESDIELGETFPETLTEALLAARVVVVFADEAYFQRWYCGKEWSLATAAFDARVRRGDDNAQEELDALVVAFPAEGLSGRDTARLPPGVQQQNCPSSVDTAKLAEHVRACLAKVGDVTLGHRLQRLEVLEVAREAFGSENALPQARPHEQPLYAPGLQAPMNHRFRGRADAMWSLHGLLAPPGRDHKATGLTGALAGGGGFGKTCMAREYFHRYGPRLYDGGCFWIDGTARDEEIEREMHGVLGALGHDLPTFEDMDVVQRRGLAGEVAAALREIPTNERVLWVVDNLPEPGEDAGGLLPVETWCPWPARVTLLTTSRLRQVHGVDHIVDVNVLGDDAALAVLNEGLQPALARDDGLAIAGWLGHLPLALDIANKALVNGALRPAELRAATEGGSITAVADRAVEALGLVVPDGALPGISELFTASYERLTAEAAEVARLMAWVSPEPVPDLVLDALIRERGGVATRVALKACSFLHQVEEGGTTTWEMHRVLADFLRSQSPVDADLPEDVEAVLQDLTEVLTKDACNDHLRRTEMLSVEPLVASLVARMTPTLQATPAAANALHDLGSALDDLGSSAGLVATTRTAIAAYRAALTGRSRTRDASAWATTQNNLGNVLQVLGQQMGDTARLEQAVSAYENALLEHTRDRAPLAWAGTQNNLGHVLKVLGQQQGDTARLEQAVSAYENALLECTRDRAPLNWTTTHNNLGNVLRALGEQMGDTARLEQAVSAYENALLECTRDRAPLDWAGTQNNLGNVLQVLGQQMGDTARLEQAVSAYENALLECTHHRAPLNWATTQNNLGNVLQVLGEQMGDTARLKQAVAAYENALLERTRDRAPLDWAGTQNNLGRVLQVLGQQMGDTARLEQAVSAYENALLEHTRDRAPLDWAGTQNNLGIVLQVLGQQMGDTARLEQAVAAYENALLECTRDRAPLNWAMTQSNLGNVLSALGEQQGDTARLEQAVSASRLALEVFEEAGADGYAAQARGNLAAAERALRDADGSPPPA